MPQLSNTIQSQSQYYIPSINSLPNAFKTKAMLRCQQQLMFWQFPTLYWVFIKKIRGLCSSGEWFLMTSKNLFWYKPYGFLFFFSWLTVVEWKDYHFLAVATVSDLQKTYWNQWPHPYEPQISNTFVSSAICLHFTAILVKFAAKRSAIKTKCLWTKSPC